MGLRERNRRNTLVVTQRTAVEMFAERGFDDVKVTEIAEAVDIAPSTLYRYFPTKESIVLWDEHEAEYPAALTRALRNAPPFEALRTAFVASLGEAYEDDIEFELQRVRLINEYPSIHAASALSDVRDRDALAELIAPYLDDADLDTATLLAGAALIAVDWAFARWQADGGATSLGELLEDGFGRMGHLDAIR